MTTYEVRGPYVSRGASQWYVWERTDMGIPQIMDVTDTEQEALESAADFRGEAS